MQIRKWVNSITGERMEVSVVVLIFSFQLYISAFSCVQFYNSHQFVSESMIQAC